MKLGVFGGSFDPVHYGHLLLAETCREACHLDEVCFMPAATAPHKQNRTLSADSKRMDMLQLAISGHPNFTVSELEMERGGVSYTVETLQALHLQKPDATLYFLMGADSLDDFHLWREPKTICELAIPVVVDRHGSEKVDLDKFAPFVSSQRMAEIEASRVVCPRIEISSTDIRARSAADRSIRFQTPRAVEKFIEAAKLYLDA